MKLLIRKIQNPPILFLLLKIILTFFTLIISFNFLFAIDKSNQSKIIWPLEEKFPISGSFAEFRNSHMHMGLDFKSFGINGFAVKSVFDGTVTFMSYSEFGYGLSILINSPSMGVTARYAHLNDLTGDVAGLEELKHALRLLGNKQGFAVKLRPQLFPVYNGKRLARLGETGTGVSHLHLEIMDKEGYINPLMLPNYDISDKTPPTFHSVFIDVENSPSLDFLAKEISLGQYALEYKDELSISGKIKIKAGGYDYMISKNRNNIYSLRIRVNDRTFYQKTLDRMSYKEAANREILYDVNKSSLNPPIYVYNFFDSINNKPSVNLNEFPENSKLNIELIFSDASSNESVLKFPIIVKKQTTIPKINKQSLFVSNDNVLKLDFSNAKIIGNGYVSIEKLTQIPEQFQSKDFYPVSGLYEVKANDFSFKGEANGNFAFSSLGQSESLYLYDTLQKRWINLNPKKQTTQMSFTLNRMGILAVMKDESPPVISFPYLTYRDYKLPELKDHRMVERFYAIYDKGSGIAKMNVLLEGSPYPFEYDRDRGYIRLEIPKSFSKFKKIFFIQVQLIDKAGNISPEFVDIVKL